MLVKQINAAPGTGSPVAGGGSRGCSNNNNNNNNNNNDNNNNDNDNNNNNNDNDNNDNNNNSNIVTSTIDNDNNNDNNMFVPPVECEFPGVSSTIDYNCQLFLLINIIIL